ncbi:MAG: hypothetical protein EOO62_00940 [Hymenobacter sp.]|nr:MAG: hypothetical protein EOO62_00940 [Hymenobacter sp.]
MPPASGNYVFRISGDDGCQLWVSPTDNAAGKVLRASLMGWTRYHDWGLYPTQQSVSMPLQAGQRYYFEVLHKENWGDDNVSVAWTLPNGTVEAPIAGAHLAPFQTGNARPAATTTAGKALPAAGAAALTEPELTVYPAPFTSQATVEFALPTSRAVTLVVFDASGWLVQRLLDGAAETGVRQQIILQGTKLAAGICTIQLPTYNTLLTRMLTKID